MMKPFETRPAGSSTKKAKGFCVTCAAIATTEALFQLDGAVIIQRYCDKCLPNANYVMGLYSRHPPNLEALGRLWPARFS